MAIGEQEPIAEAGFSLPSRRNEEVGSLSSDFPTQETTRRADALRTWTAQDFSNIYVRFRPILILDAKRVLRSEMQAEEVVQDAFLYLMTSLPELDSEVGVLKFLRWKTKMLCFDVQKSSSSSVHLYDFQQIEFLVDESEPVDQLIRADDAAIVQLALAKLSSRHRQVILDSVILEKSNAELASDLSLSENAFRQLLYRAKGAFRAALVNESKTAGLSISQLLGVASRSIRGLGAHKIASLLLVTGLASGMIVTQGQIGSKETESSLSAPASLAEQNVSESARGGLAPNFPKASESEIYDDILLSPSDENLTENNATPDSRLEVMPGAESSNSRVESPAVGTREEVVQGQEAGDTKTNSGSQDMNAEFGPEALASIASAASSNPSISSSPLDLEGQLVSVSTGTGLDAHLVVGSSGQVRSAWFTLRVDGNYFGAVPLVSYSRVDESSTGKTVLFAATDLRIGDLSGVFEGATTEDNPLSRSILETILRFSIDGELVEGTLRIVQRS